MNGVTERGNVSAEGYAVKLGAAIVSKHLPSIFSWLLTRFRGINLLVIGPGAAGKSSFIDYLLDGELRPASSEHVVTGDIEEHSQVTLDVGEARSLVLRVSKTTEIPGQGRSALHHANMLVQRNVTDVVLILDASKSESVTVAWVRDFFGRASELYKSDVNIAKRLKRMTIAVNKMDIVASGKDFVALRSAVRAAMRAGGKDFSADSISAIPIFPCTAVRTGRDRSLINDVIVNVARGVRRS